MKDEWKARLNAQKNEGCNIHGFVTVNRIPGNFHFAPGYSFQVNSMHLHDLRAFPDMKFDFTHYIHYLAFGEYHPSLILPLNGVNKTGLGENDVFTYFIKVVSTEFLYLNSSMLDTNQYSVTQHHRQVQAGGSGLSGRCFVSWQLQACSPSRRLLYDPRLIFLICSARSLFQCGNIAHGGHLSRVSGPFVVVHYANLCDCRWCVYDCRSLGCIRVHGQQTFALQAKHGQSHLMSCFIAFVYFEYFE